MPEKPRDDDSLSLVDKMENLEGRATRDFLSGDYRLPEPPRQHCGLTIPSSAKLTAFDLLNVEVSTGERRLFALVDAASCVLAHNGRYGGEETARLAFETVVSPAVALAAVRVLTSGPEPA